MSIVWFIKKTSNILHNIHLCPETKRNDLYTQDTQCPAGISCDRMIMEHIHDEYCNIPLTLCTCNSRAGIAAWE
jgi:hypothetical protein